MLGDLSTTAYLFLPRSLAMPSRVLNPHCGCNIGEGGDILQDTHREQDHTGSGAINKARPFWLGLPLSSWLAQWIEEGVPLHWEDLSVKAPRPVLSKITQVP